MALCYFLFPFPKRPFVKKLINKVDFEALSVKMNRCKELFFLLSEADPTTPSGTVPAAALAVDLIAGGLSQENTHYVSDFIKSTNNN